MKATFPKIAETRTTTAIIIVHIKKIKSPEEAGLVATPDILK